VTTHNAAASFPLTHFHCSGNYSLTNSDNSLLRQYFTVNICLMNYLLHFYTI